MEEQLCGKVLIIGPDMNDKGGIATIVKQMSQIMHPFNFICSRWNTSKISKTWQMGRAVIKELRWILFRNVQILHIHTASYTSFYVSSVFLIVGKLCRKKILLHIHGGKFIEFYQTNKRFVKYICNKADCVIGVSSYFINQFRLLGLNTRLELLYNSVEIPDIISHVGFRRPKTITFMGAIVANKGIFDVIACLIKYKSYFEGKIHFYIAGLGEHDRLQDLIKDNELDGFVHYIGWIDEDKKRTLLSRTDIYIQPSCFESLGISIIEAMSYGVPAIASNVGGIPDIIEDGVDGILFQPNDFEQFVGALKRLIEDEELNRILGTKAREKSLKFSINNFRDKLVDIYTSC